MKLPYQLRVTRKHPQSCLQTLERLFRPLVKVGTHIDQTFTTIDGEGEESGSENDAPKSMLSFSFGTSFLGEWHPWILIVFHLHFLDKEKSPTPEPESDGEPKVVC